MSSITDQQAAVIALFVESVCYGIYVVTFGLCLRTLLWMKHGEGMKPWSQVNHVMLVICLIMPITATINLTLNVVRAVESAGPSGVSEQFLDLGSATEVTKFFCVNFQTLIADFMLTYRCWVIYGRSWIVAILPSLLWLGVFVSSVLNLIVLRNTHDAALTAAKSLRPIVTSFWAISITLNVVATLLIVWRLYSTDRDLSVASVARLSDSMGRNKYRWIHRIMRIIIESGVLYTSVAISTCITYATGSQGVYVTSAIEMQTVGIAFNLIIIRVARADRTGYTTKTTRQNTTIPLHFIAAQQTKDLEVSVTQETRSDELLRGYKRADSEFQKGTATSSDTAVSS